MGNIAFDNDKYLQTQSEHIRQRIDQFGGKLYLEFGGKLFDDFHASRVLPGFQPDSKLRMLLQIRLGRSSTSPISVGCQFLPQCLDIFLRCRNILRKYL